MPARITAIIPTFNRALLMAEAVHSILAQTRMVTEIIVVDDGSTDNTGEIATQLGTIMAGAKHSDSVPAFHLYTTENGGKSRALNLALAKAQGDYIWICNDDDIALPHAVDTLAGLLDADPALVAVGGSYRRFSVHGKSGKKTEYGPGYWPDLSSGTALRHILEDLFVFQNATMVRKTAYEAVGPFREDLRHSLDYDMIVRLACAGPIKLTDDPVFLQRKHDGKGKSRGSREVEASSKKTWKKTDKDVFAVFREKIPLAMYEGMYRAEDPKVVRRAALLQRAAVFARRADWDMALRDFADAAKLAPGYRLSEMEQTICQRALAGKYGCKEALTSEIRRKLRDVAGMSASGGSITRALSRGIAWRGKVAMREGRISEAGSVATFVSALKFAHSGHGRGDRPGPVFENDQLPEPTYRII
ncbi:MAG: glycosyltransferase family 2 protein [Pseudomonadota bacterium]